MLELPPWSVDPASVPATPCLVKDAARARAVEAAIAALVAPRLPSGLALHLLSGIRGPDDLPFALEGVGAPGSRQIALGLLPPHAMPGPFAADPYDGAAFELCRRMRDEGREPEVLVSGLWGSPQRPRVVEGRIWELCRIAYELRASFGVAPRAIALLGGLRPGWLERRRDPQGPGGWARVGDAVGRAVTAYGLVVDKLGVDVGPLAEALATALVTTVVAEGRGDEDTIACDAPASALSLVRPGPILDAGASAAPLRWARLVSALEPGVTSLPHVALPAGAAPARIRLPLLGVPAGVPRSSRDTSEIPAP